MAIPQLRTLIEQLRRSVSPSSEDTLTDAQLLRRWTEERDEAAFEVLLWGHGPMVLAVCRRLLRGNHDIEDAFQAAFLTLVRKGASIRRPEAVAAWLHRVTSRIALRLRGTLAERARHERPGIETMAIDRRAGEPADDLRAVLDAEIDALPERYRRAFILCCLEGKTHAEAARLLGRPPGTVSCWLKRGRERLRGRLIRRGIAPAVAITALGETQIRDVMAGALVKSACGAAKVLATDGEAAISHRVSLLVDGALRGMALTKLKMVMMLVLALSVAAGGAGMLAYQAPAVQQPAPQQEAKVQAAEQPRGQEERAARIDRYGDPLPPGALARLGTVRLRHAGDVFQVDFTPDGKALLSGGGDETIRFWDPATGKQLRQFTGQPRSIGGFALAPDGKRLATTTHWTQDSIYLWDAVTGRKLHELRGTKIGGGPLVFSPDSKVLASSGKDSHVHLWDAATGKELFNLNGHNTSKFDWQNEVHTLAFSPDGKWLVTAGKDGIGAGGMIRVWDRGTGKQAFVLTCRDEPVTALAFTPDGQHMISGGYFYEKQHNIGSLRLWDLATRKQIREFRTEKEQDAIVAVAISPDGKTLASGCMDKTVRLWNLATGKLLRPLRGRRDNYLAHYSLAFSPDGNQLASGGNGHEVYLWDVKTGKRLGADASGHESTIRSLVLSADGRLLVTASEDYTIGLWDLTARRFLHRLRGHTHGVTAVDLSPDGKSVASVGYDSTLRLWDTASGKDVRTIQVGRSFSAQGFCVAFSPDGKVLASGHLGGEAKREGDALRLWEVATGRPLRQFDRPPGWTTALVFSPDGQTLTAGGLSRDIRRWRVSTGEVARQWTIQRQERLGSPVAFSRDATLMASVDDQKSVELRDLRTGKPRGTFKVPPGFGRRLALSPDNRFLAACYAAGVRPLPAEDDHAIHVWETASGKEIARFEVPAPNAVSSAAFSPNARTLLTGMDDATVLLWNLVPHGVARPPADLWTDLAGEEAVQARAAVWALSTAPEQAVPLLQARLRPTSPPEERRIARLIADLNSDRFEVRDKASRELEALGELAVSALRKTLEDQPSLEVRRRIDALLEKQERPVLSPPQLQALRGVEILERIGTAEAQQVLKTLARGMPEARVTREAKAALERLTKRRG
jgi:RNA polymerase sigma factor (sigma-70 family)